LWVSGTTQLYVQSGYHVVPGYKYGNPYVKQKDSAGNDLLYNGRCYYVMDCPHVNCVSPHVYIYFNGDWDGNGNGNGRWELSSNGLWHGVNPSLYQWEDLGTGGTNDGSCPEASNWTLATVVEDAIGGGHCPIDCCCLVNSACPTTTTTTTTSAPDECCIGQTIMKATQCVIGNQGNPNQFYPGQTYLCDVNNAVGVMVGDFVMATSCASPADPPVCLKILDTDHQTGQTATREVQSTCNDANASCDYQNHHPTCP
jgi:hypothetical protein